MRKCRETDISLGLRTEEEADQAHLLLASLRSLSRSVSLSSTLARPTKPPGLALLRSKRRNLNHHKIVLAAADQRELIQLDQTEGANRSVPSTARARPNLPPRAYLSRRAPTSSRRKLNIGGLCSERRMDRLSLGAKRKKESKSARPFSSLSPLSPHPSSLLTRKISLNH